MFDPRDLASAIRKLRGTRHQNALAKSVGVSPGTWCKWEQGGTTPRQVSLVRIAQALGCSVDRLRQVMEECRRERVGREAEPEARPPHPAPIPLVQETDRLLRKIDRQLDSLMSSKNALLRMREQLVASQG
jgi:transcriptional regulator with XRE-family HTH domain